MRKGWREVALGTVASQRREPVRLTSDEVYRLMGIRWKNLGAYERGRSDTTAVKAKTMYRMKIADFVFNRIDTDKGAFSVVGADMDGSVASNEFPAYRCVPEELIPEYLWLHFQQPEVLASLRPAGSDGRARWKEADFERYTLRLPPLEEQQRIVDLIGSLDETIEVADVAAQSAGQAYMELGGSLGGANFERRTIGEVVSKAKAGGTPSRKVSSFYGGGIPWLKSGEVVGSEIRVTEETITQAAVDGSSAWIAPSESTVVAMYGATAGQVGQLRNPVAMNQAVIALVPNTKMVTPEYFYHAVKSQSADLKSKARGAAQPNLSKEIVVGHPIAVPSLDRQPVITAAFKSTEETASLTHCYATSLRTLRSELLTVLLSGEHEIPESYDVATASPLEPAA